MKYSVENFIWFRLTFTNSNHFLNTLMLKFLTRNTESGKCDRRISTWNTSKSIMSSFINLCICVFELCAFKVFIFCGFWQLPATIFKKFLQLISFISHLQCLHQISSKSVGGGFSMEVLTTFYFCEKQFQYTKQLCSLSCKLS